MLTLHRHDKEKPSRNTRTHIRSYFSITKETPQGSLILDAKKLITELKGEEPSWGYMLYLGCQALMEKHGPVGTPKEPAV